MMNFPRLVLTRTLVLLLPIIAPSLSAQVGEGLFAVFDTTRGEFTCRLYFKRAPRTVANFVSLAEGSRPWVDFSNAKISTAPFYDQTTFHRVIKDFVIQGGSPNATGTDGPGYRFRDELHQELKHDRAGMLSMAKTAQPHTNGSQFFVTLAPTPWLDNIHSVFGAVVSGQDIVTSIGNTQTVPGDRPTETQWIKSVRILRSGLEAEAFNPLTVEPPLPTVRPIQTQIIRTTEGLEVHWAGKEHLDYHAFFSPNLEDWSVQTLRPVGSAGLGSFTGSFPIQFFHFIEAEHDAIPTL